MFPAERSACSCGTTKQTEELSTLKKEIKKATPYRAVKVKETTQLGTGPFRTINIGQVIKTITSRWLPLTCVCLQAQWYILLPRNIQAYAWLVLCNSFTEWACIFGRNS